MPTLTAAPEPDDYRERTRRLSAALQRARRRMKDRKRAKWVLPAVGGLVIYLALSSSAPFFVVFLAGAVINATINAVAARRLREAIADVVDLDYPDTLSLLLEAWHLGDEGTRRAAGVGLKRLLPQVTDAHRGELTQADVRAIAGLLTQFEPDLIEAALTALEHVGDAQSLEKIQTLLGLARGTVSARPAVRPAVYLAQWLDSLPRLAEHAKRVAAAIETRLDEERRNALLLRPAVPAKETLLRPATGHVSEPPEQLLRAIDTTSEP